MTGSPRNIILLKGHSAGVGDLLRSSAAWRALKDRYPDGRLHLVFLTQDPGAASEELIARHHLLASFHVRPKWPTSWSAWRDARRWFIQLVRDCEADLIIDFESAGVRTAMLAWLARQALGVGTIGIADVPGRGWFYQKSVPSRRRVQAAGMVGAVDYSDLDFVVLTGLGIRRNGQPIELEEAPEAVRFRIALRSRHGIPPELPLVGLNVGCGTPGALDRRPDLPLLRLWLERLQRGHRCAVVLSGAAYERTVNADLIAGYRPPAGLPVVNLAGETRLIELPGLIRSCCLFVSGDSGPYHVAVALRVPTVVIFNRSFPAAEHHHPWVRSVIAPGPEEIAALEAAVSGLRETFPWSREGAAG